jgi:hypothetical protein
MTMAKKKPAPVEQTAPEPEVPATSEPVAKTVRPKLVQQNGVSRPNAGTQTARVWEITDALSEQAGKPARRKDVLDIGLKEGLNASTIATQFGRWRKFHGLKGTDEASAS